MTPPLDRLTAALADRYRIDRELGAGGMATVYLADDLRHERKVALKVLRPELAAVIGAERFLKEIKVTANLQHPHILGLIDSGEVDGLLWYAMPFVEGESLRDLLQREKQLPIPDAVRIATEVAGALDYAHRHGVIHRDIKPENILLHDGSALVADFGIALAASTAGTRMTETGMSLGTPHYMSPEQAMGEREISARSDVYALGCITYEMLTGDPPFTGSTAQAIVAKVVTERPHPLRSQRHTIPPQVEAAVLTALEKLPADRFASAAEFAAALADRGFTTAAVAAQGATASDARWRRIAAVAGLLAVAMGVAAGIGWSRRGSPGLVHRFYVSMDRSLPSFANPIVSPDGSRFIYSDDEGSLMLRPSDGLDARPIPGSEASWAPTFSPDGREIVVSKGFPGPIQVISLEGGAIRTLVADSAYGSGLAWSEDDWIYYFHGEEYGRDLMRIRATGGAPEFVGRPDQSQGALFFIWPQALPGSRLILLSVQPLDGDSRIGVLDPATGEVTLIATGTTARYAPTGHLLVVGIDGTLQAARFDPATGEVSGGFTVVAEGLAIWSSIIPSIGLSDAGTLLYQPAPPDGQVVRVSRDGGREESVDPNWRGTFNTVSLSPDGTRLAIGVGRAGRTELWVRDLRSDVMTKLSSGGTFNYRPSWSADGREVIFTSDQGGKITTYRVRADGSSPPSPLVQLAASVDEAVYSADGQWLILRAGSGGGRDVLARRVSDDSTVVRLVASSAEEFSPTLSPDGRWLAYASDETGRTEVYVRPFPDTESAKYTISRGGGAEPVWSPAGGELFFRDGNDNLVAAVMAPGPGFQVASTRVLFSIASYFGDNRHRGFTVAPDGRSFLFIKSPGILSGSNQLVVTLNWFEELKRKVGK